MPICSALMPRSDRRSRRRLVRSAPIGPEHPESGTDRAAPFGHGHFGHTCIGRSVGATPQHLVDLVGGTREHSLDAAVARIAHAAVEPQRPRGLLGPGAVIDALHPPLDFHSDSLVGGLGHAHANSRITASTLRRSPGLASTLDTLPSRSAFSTFSIFIASTPQSASPALTSSDTTMPGSGQSRNFEVSAFSLTGIRAASSVSRSVTASTETSTPS